VILLLAGDFVLSSGSAIFAVAATSLRISQSKRVELCRNRLQPRISTLHPKSR